MTALWILEFIPFLEHRLIATINYSPGARMAGSTYGKTSVGSPQDGCGIPDSSSNMVNFLPLFMKSILHCVEWLFSTNLILQRKVLNCSTVQELVFLGTIQENTS